MSLELENFYDHTYAAVFQLLLLKSAVLIASLYASSIALSIDPGIRVEGDVPGSRICRKWLT